MAVNKIVLRGGDTLIDLTGDTVTAANLASGVTAHDASGAQITGSMADSTESTTITVSSAGLITAKTTRTAGYASAGTTNTTKQLTTQAAKTITPSTAQQTAVASGVYTTGAVIVSAVPTETKTVALSMLTGNQTISRTSGKFMTSVTVQKPASMIPSNIKKGITIGGVTGTYEGSSGGSSSETWVLTGQGYKPGNSEFICTLPQAAIEEDVVSWDANFSSNGGSFTSFNFISQNYGQLFEINYGDTYAFGGSWSASEELLLATFDQTSNAYRKLTFTTPPTGDFLAWLQENAVKQASDTAIEPEKSVTITSNGTAEITPDVPYDAMAKVSVTTNVAGASTTTLALTLDSQYYIWPNTGDKRHQGTVYNAGTHQFTVPLNSSVVLSAMENSSADYTNASGCNVTTFGYFMGNAGTALIDITGENPSATFV